MAPPLWTAVNDQKQFRRRVKYARLFFQLVKNTPRGIVTVFDYTGEMGMKQKSPHRSQKKREKRVALVWGRVPTRKTLPLVVGGAEIASIKVSDRCSSLLGGGLDPGL